MYPGIKNQCVVVTGGAKGIGAACVRLLTELGAKVALFDIDFAVAREFASSLPGACLPCRVDVSNSAEVQAAFAQVASELGPPTLLVNNAGIGLNESVLSTTEEQWDRVLGVNLKSYFLCAQAALPHMLATGRGAIVNVASVQSFVSQKRSIAYCASKAGILGLSRAIAVDHAPTIRSNAVCPGTVDTPMLAEAIANAPNKEDLLDECRNLHLLKRIAQPEEIAQLVAFLLSDLASFITGQAIRIDGGMGLEIGGNVRN
jgi:NAD(P)-dependent dehydrogenase (short-subunit alcohol dehydrogenase family)